MRPKRRSSLRLGLGLTLVLGLEAEAQRPANVDPAPRQRLGVVDGFTLTAVGDLIQTHPISIQRTPGFATLLELLKGSSATFGNFESTAIDPRDFGGYPQAEYGGLWVRSDPAVIPDLKQMGFDVFARANNHSTDWGIEGMRETDRRLDQAGFVHAGTGETRALARAAQYLSTPQGTVAIVSMASSYTPLSRAMNPLGQAPGRPGISAVRTSRKVLVSAEQFRQLKQIYQAQPPGSYLPPADTSSKDLELFGVRYRVSDAIRNEVAFSYDLDSVDAREIRQSIRQGKENSDFLIATIHTHEPGNWSDAPPDFLPILARSAIDNGADVFVGHGPHQLRGIEIYHGRPIFYSLGNFFFQVESIEPNAMDIFEQFKKDPSSTTDHEFLDWWHQRFFGGKTAPLWYQSVLTVTRYARGGVSEIRLYPVELGFAEPDVTKGVPRPAPPEVAREILDRLVRLSKPFGTTIEIEGNVGVIRVDAGAAKSP
jgi:poly-gamma-glutamate synthesis protein (capsule biosynthesis protein)